ncbi:transcription antitermination factor NusB [Paludifilum halophilum]|nr:transcription antitermination factor NusB [Paludifilum halophilum]
MGRRQVREKVLQTLYQYEMNEEARENLIRKKGRALERETGKDSLEFFLRLTRGVIQNQEKLDHAVEPFLKKDWTMSRLSIVDRMILRMAAYELLLEKEIPEGATLNEAVELAKTFSTEESARFINGVLGNITENLEEVKGGLIPEEPL